MDIKKDEILNCCECGVQFIFTLGEQTFYASKGGMPWPRRCKPCRDNRKLTLNTLDKAVRHG